jgi:hypothetical protein
VASVVALAAIALLLPRTADAAPQAPLATSTTCDTVYGCEGSSTVGPINPSCSLNKTSAAPGETVTATITNIPAGSAVSLLFDGNQVGSENADANGKATVSFTVPNGSTSSSHTVVFSGAGFSCDATGGAGFDILGSNQRRGGLSTTGIDVALYLAIALVFIVAGWQFVLLARARRRRAARAAASRSGRPRHSVSR